MLADRDYMREPGRRDPLSVTAKLCLVLAVVFALQCINGAYLHSPVEGWLALTRTGLRHFYLWQILTFQFLHAGFLHLLFNLLTLWWLGRYAEAAIGSRRMLLAFFGTGAVGGLLQGALMLLFPSVFGPMMFGASAGVCGLLAIFARLESESVIQIYGILPIKAWTLLMGLVIVSVFFTIVPVDPGVAHAAHLGGMLAGLGFVKLGWHHDYIELPWQGLGARIRYLFRRRKPAPVLTPRFTPTPAAAAKQSQPARPVGDDMDYISREVDPILDKIAAQGIQSLTAREKKILEDARGRMGKR
ncbi:MAG TPA: rhomboid family intramembrane serine protease [Candidatus Limnocylindria bacterium]|nr:rhomboid family intramembrane serine protease [Candidatus Limnocylindria bacterium]